MSEWRCPCCDAPKSTKWNPYEEGYTVCENGHICIDGTDIYERSLHPEAYKMHALRDQIVNKFCEAKS